MALFLFLNACLMQERLPAVELETPGNVVLKIPDVAVRTPSNEDYQLRRATTGLRTIICFYRGYWCPYGMGQLKELRNVEGELEALNFRVLALSPDRPARVRQTAEEFGAGFVLLSDNKMQAARGFQIVHHVGGAEWQQFRRYGLDLEFISDETHHELPRPALFFVGRDGRIGERFVPERVSQRMGSEEILKTARGMIARENADSR